MAGRPLGRKNIRSYMASDEMERLKINPIEGAMKAIEELDELIALNIQAYKSMRGLSEKSDEGSAYLANAIRGVTAKKDTYLSLAKFRYPTLTAIGVKDLGSNAEERKPLNTEQAINILRQDPFFKEKVETQDVISAMTETREITVLSGGLNVGDEDVHS